MAHLCNRRGYWSLEESYRPGPGMKPRKRRLAYYGKYGPPIEVKQMFDGTDYGVDWHSFEYRPAVEDESRLPPGLHLGPIDPVPVEPHSGVRVGPTDPVEPIAPPNAHGSVAPDASPDAQDQPSEPSPDAGPSSSSEPS
jgi:hypothetical protein